jgi:hypothetical protein
VIKRANLASMISQAKIGFGTRFLREEIGEKYAQH